jgi:hypothetical protein
MVRVLGRRRAPLVLAALGCSFAIGACGSSGSSAGTTASGAGNAGLKFAQCMRSHGVSDFPDPGADGGGLQFQGSGGINPQSPSFQAAQRACQRILGPSTPRTPPTAAENAAAVKFAQCMRTHGVPSFPDPTTSTGVISRGLFLHGMVFSIGSGINPQSPAFTQAAGACGLKLQSPRG